MFQPQPEWQWGPGIPAGNQRTVPDVSLFSDPSPGWTIYCTDAGCPGDTGWQTIGGTSAATPLWAFRRLSPLRAICWSV